MFIVAYLRKNNAAAKIHIKAPLNAYITKIRVPNVIQYV